MAGFLSKLFGKKSVNTTKILHYPPSMMSSDPEKDTAFGKAVLAYYNEFGKTMEHGMVPDAEMEAFYQNHVTDEAKKMIFSENCGNMAQILTVLSEKMPAGVLSRTDHLKQVLHFYIEVFSRAIIMDPYEVRDSMINKHPYMQEELAADCTAVSLALLSLSNKELGSRIMIQNGLKLMTQDNAVKNADIETKYLDDPDYGLNPEKPVFINGFGPHHIYLDSLCTEEGVMLKNNRRGSMPVDGIEGPVDIYDLFLPNEKNI